ncbi:MAG: DUF748 domain-containing protein, partial [archaeon]|nr:DUF748 domain-containing protein [archaeon]
MKRTVVAKKSIYIPCIAVLLYTLAGFFLLPYFGKNILQDKLGNSLNRNVLIEKISINPYALTANFDSLIIKDKEDNKIFVSVKKIFLNFSLSSLFTFSANISQFSVENPYVNIIQNKDNSFNFSDLIKPKKDSTSGKLNDNQIIKFSLDNCTIIDGKIEYTDKIKNISHTMDDFSFSLPFISSKPNYIKKKSGMDINFELNDAKFDIHIDSTPFAKNLSTKIDIKTSDIDFIHYLPYFSIPDNLQLQSLNFNCDLHADFLRENSDNLLVLDGNISISNLELKDSLKTDIIKFQELDIELLKSKILDKQLNIAKIVVIKPQLNLICDKNGKLNFLKSPSQSIKKEDYTNKTPEKNNSFLLNLTDFEIQEGSMLFKNNTNEEMITLPGLNIKNFTFDAENKKIKVGIITAGNGNIFVKRQNNNNIDYVEKKNPEKELERTLP